MSDRKKRGSSRGTVTWKGDSLTSPSLRRSGRNSSSLNKSTESPIPPQAMKRSITAKKIMPRKTLAALASAETQPKTTSTPQRTSAATISRSTPTASLRVSGSKPFPRRSSRVSAGKENANLAISQDKENAVLDKSQDVCKDATDHLVVSKIDVLSPIPLNVPQSPSYDDRAKVMSQKVRRSYSRLEMSLNGGSFLYSPTRDTDSSDTSTPNSAPKAGRRSLFGFDKLLNSETVEEETEKRRDGEASKRTNQSATGTSFRFSLEEPDPNIPGVVIAKQKRRKRKIPQIEKTDLDEWAAAMNAQFEEAENFDLVVE